MNIAENAQSRCGGRLTVLIIENHAASLALLQDFLQARFPAWKIISAENVAEAVALSITRRPFFALADINLPDANGIDLAAALLKQRGDLRVIMVSVQDSALHRSLASAAGAAGYVRKDRIPLELEPLLGRLLAEAGEGVRQ